MDAAAIIMGFLGIAVSAFLLWAIVRSANHGWRKTKWIWAAIVFVLLGYPLSYGPVLWLANKGYLPVAVKEIVAAAYIPLFTLIDKTDTISLFEWYGSLWVEQKPEIIYDNETHAQ
jgi:hypothetical protein